MRIGDYQMEIDSLNAQIKEQQSLDHANFERERYEQALEKMREQHSRVVQQHEEEVAKLRADLDEKCEHARRLNHKVDDLMRNLDASALEKADNFARLTVSLNELNQKCLYLEK